jgi:hypothetical protein
MVQRRGKVNGVPTNSSVKFNYYQKMCLEGDKIVLTYDHPESLKVPLGRDKRWEMFENASPNDEQDGNLTQGELKKQRIQRNRESKKQINTENRKKDKHSKRLVKRDEVKQQSADDEENDKEEEQKLTYAQVVRVDDHHNGRNEQPPPEPRVNKIALTEEQLHKLPSYSRNKNKGFEVKSIEVSTVAAKKNVVNKASKWQDGRYASERNDKMYRARDKNDMRKDWQADLTGGV